eukprot:XP_001692731.1 predicted protein [Chlamydomonas reinhardtii]
MVMYVNEMIDCFKTDCEIGMGVPAWQVGFAVGTIRRRLRPGVKAAKQQQMAWAPAAPGRVDRRVAGQGLL